MLGIRYIAAFDLIFSFARRRLRVFEATATKESSMDGYGSEIVLVSALAEGLQGPVPKRVRPHSGLLLKRSSA